MTKLWGLLALLLSGFLVACQPEVGLETAAADRWPPDAGDVVPIESTPQPQPSPTSELFTTLPTFTPYFPYPTGDPAPAATPLNRPSPTPYHTPTSRAQPIPKPSPPVATVVAAGPVMREVTVYAAERCFDRPFAPSSGLAYDQQGMAVTYAEGKQVRLWGEPDSFREVFALFGGETFLVFEGPFCFTFVGEDGVQQARRRWRVRTDHTFAEGWIDEYVGTADNYLHTAAPAGPSQPPQLEYFTVSPEKPTIYDEISLTWALRHVPHVILAGGGLSYPPLSPLWGMTVPAAELTLDSGGCTTFTLSAANPQTEPLTVSRPLCVDLNPGLVVTHLAVAPEPLTGPGLVPAAISWQIHGFDPAVHAAVLTWSEFGYPDKAVALTQTSGTLEVMVNITLPGTMVFRLDVTGGPQTVYKEAVVAVATGCLTPRITNDPTLPQECPSTPIVSSRVRVQPFERGIMLWRDAPGDERPLVVFYQDGTAYAPHVSLWQGKNVQITDTPPAGLAAPGSTFAVAWSALSGVRDKLGWATQAEIAAETGWQVIASHVVINMVDGGQRRYLIYDGDYGMWVPIAPQHVP